MSHIKLVFGAAPLGTTPFFPDDSSVLAVFDMLEAGGCNTLDTTNDWKGAEAVLGRTKAGKRFTIDSKTPGGIIPGTSTRAGILQHATELSNEVGAENVDVYYIHAPDETLDLEEMLAGIDDAHKAGLFKRFGVSNYPPEEVEKIHAICQARGYPLPSVFQGSSNPVSRKAEEKLFPTLRKLGMSFYAYSPMAGGFLTKTPAQIIGGGQDAGRFAGSGFLANMANALYNKPSYLKALEMWDEIATEAGISKAELANRWVASNSTLSKEHGDALIMGASKPQHVADTITWLNKGPLRPAICERIEQVWKTVEKDAFIDNFQSYAHGKMDNFSKDDPFEKKRERSS